MNAWKSLACFGAALAATLTVGVGWATGVGATDQDLPDLGSPANAAISLEEEY